MSRVFRRRATNRAVKGLVEVLRDRDWHKVETHARHVLAVLADEPCDSPETGTDADVAALRAETATVFSELATSEVASGSAVGIDPATILLIVQLVLQLIDVIRKSRHG